LFTSRRRSYSTCGGGPIVHLDMWAFAAAVIWNAFLLFLVQPLIAKQLLPLFGGTAAVWALCLVFYQVALLGGYLYAHALARRFPPAIQARVHAGLVLLSCAVLPVGVSAGVSASGANPQLELFWLLLKAIGLPYFVLATTSPLMQHWYSLAAPEGRAYRLFAWSNLSCTLALLSFPFLLERVLPLSVLNRFWSAGYLVSVVLALCAAWSVAGTSNIPERAGTVNADAGAGWGRRIQWIFFSALGSVFLLAITNHMTQVVAPVPFLWVVPLLLYLMTFVAVFERDWYSSRWGVWIGFAGFLIMIAGLLFLPPGKMLGPGVIVFSLGLFLACLFCHGELAVRKPAASHLTLFYILMAAGGAAGSILVALVAPRVFEGYFELPVAIAFASLIACGIVYRRWWLTDIAAVSATILIASVAAGAVMSHRSEAISTGRNFYGSLRVLHKPATAEKPEHRTMFHGAVNHGTQFVDPNLRRMPNAYFSPASGAGLWLSATRGSRHVGIIGLGAGTLAAYGQPGDVIRFYEINPLVVEMARRDFTYLSDSAAQVEVVLGDARLQLQQENPRGYDLFVVDAFSGDSIPIHLITKEAFQLYVRHLKPGGVIALHITNDYLHLYPIVKALAQSVGMQSVHLTTNPDKSRNVYFSSWALVGPAAALQRLPTPAQLASTTGAPVWTDDFNSLLDALK